MHDIKWIRENPEVFDAGLARRGLPAKSPEILELDRARREHQTELQELQSRRNQRSKDIGAAKSKGEDANAIMEEVAAIKTRMAELETLLTVDVVADELSGIPNILAPDVPDGADESGNKEVRVVGAAPSIASAKDHVELGENLGMMDFATAAKISGARFVVLTGALARLERALAQFMLDLHTQEFGYTETNPPFLVRDAALYGTGQLPKFSEDLFEIHGELKNKQIEMAKLEAISTERGNANEYLGQINEELGKGAQIALSQGVDLSWMTSIFQKLANKFTENSKEFVELREQFLQFKSDFYLMAKSGTSRQFLIPTSEVSLTNIVADSILDAESLPRRYTAHTPCFRSEAGSAGRDTRGMIRQHQFSKVEMVSITHPDESEKEHERMLGAAEEVLKRLGLHYRVMLLCAGDTGFSARKTYDLEVWLPGQNAFREISSCSNCGDFQARRMKARFKDGKENRFVHTLNGSGVAVGRALVAVMENYQQADGSIAIPDVLQPYMGGMKRIEKAA